ncbi:hypothetical protein FISHEDRAFT_78261 [Fistulina hepatica ATCC 64428]|nr:hypothetical protein FISHEDRAFT_78261 [Fistulina hepatica ATCC 64428]
MTRTRLPCLHIDTSIAGTSCRQEQQYETRCLAKIVRQLSRPPQCHPAAQPSIVPGIPATFISRQLDALAQRILFENAPPTHLLAVRYLGGRHDSRLVDTITEAAVGFDVYPCDGPLFLPVHSHIIGARCSRLAALAAADTFVDVQAVHDAADVMSVPIVPFDVPEPHLLPSLLDYLYTHSNRSLAVAVFPELNNSRAFLASLEENLKSCAEDVDISTPSLISTSCQPVPSPIPDLTAYLVHTYPHSDGLHRPIARVFALYENACAIGVTDNSFWHVLGKLWAALCSAADSIQERA